MLRLGIGSLVSTWNASARCMASLRAATGAPGHQLQLLFFRGENTIQAAEARCLRRILARGPREPAGIAAPATTGPGVSKLQAQGSALPDLLGKRVRSLLRPQLCITEALLQGHALALPVLQILLGGAKALLQRAVFAAQRFELPVLAAEATDEAGHGRQRTRYITRPLGGRSALALRPSAFVRREARLPHLRLRLRECMAPLLYAILQGRASSLDTDQLRLCTSELRAAFRLGPGSCRRLRLGCQSPGLGCQSHGLASRPLGLWRRRGRGCEAVGKGLRLQPCHLRPWPDSWPPLLARCLRCCGDEEPKWLPRCCLCRWRSCGGREALHEATVSLQGIAPLGDLWLYSGTAKAASLARLAVCLCLSRAPCSETARRLSCRKRRRQDCYAGSNLDRRGRRRCCRCGNGGVGYSLRLRRPEAFSKPPLELRHPGKEAIR
mmetsp:Transcript_97187/g.217522  ORF Transcript_97187/g.217522 Transcript_97187/m.217522 type:complete len:438 (-) Transcript_97187:140-1453(-)